MSLHNDLTTDELRDLLESGTDFLHYIGHVDDSGIRCIDGMLDVETIEESGVRGFFLNGCRSYEQGEKLVEKGSQVGVVTLTKIGNEPATEVGKKLARLLNHGFPMQSALSVVTDVNAPNRKYVVVGDGSQELIESQCGAPAIISPEKIGDEISLKIQPYPTINATIGALQTTQINDLRIHSINSTILEEQLSRESLNEYFENVKHPVQSGAGVLWPEEVSVDEDF
ncbi:hypothetical protein [Halorussus lipolyticus]|uniref:hypothetical protein n=1 Tax=Halorussus lipolyticus TaxID=3034024 RepID=UPI0023E77C2B|nr:hypothetical protein [Halorussus sp. DT80]